MTWQQERGSGWQWQQCGTSFSNGGAPLVQKHTVKELEAWRSGNWTKWTCTNCQTVGWSCVHCGVKKSYASALSTTSLHSWIGWTQPKTNSTSQVAQQLQSVEAQLPSVCGSDQAQTGHSLVVPSADSSGSGEGTRQIKQVKKALSSLDMDVPALEASRTTTRRVEDTAKRATTSEQKREGSSTESAKKSRGVESRVHPGLDKRHSSTDCKGYAQLLEQGLMRTNQKTKSWTSMAQTRSSDRCCR